MSTRQRLCLAVRLGNWRQSPLLTTKCQKISKSLQLWMRCTVFHSTTLFVVTKTSSQSPLSYGIWQISYLSDGMLFSTQQIITSNLKLYHILIWKTLPSMSQLIHKCRKNHAILRDISCGTACKKLHFTYLFFYQTTPIFAVATTSWNFFSILNE